MAKRVQALCAQLVERYGGNAAAQPDGWREAAGPYGEDGVYRSVADVTDEQSLGTVRASKKAAKSG